MQALYIDTSGWAALEVTTEDNHEAAQQFSRGPGRAYRWVTTNWVVWETVTLLRMRTTHAAAVRFGDRIHRSTNVEILRVSENDELAAWSVFRRYNDKAFGFTDCISFAVMQTMGIQAAFTFDHHFRQAGFSVLPGLP